MPSNQPVHRPGHLVRLLLGPIWLLLTIGQGVLYASAPSSSRLLLLVVYGVVAVLGCAVSWGEYQRGRRLR